MRSAVCISGVVSDICDTANNLGMKEGRKEEIVFYVTFKYLGHFSTIGTRNQEKFYSLYKYFQTGS